MKREKGVVLSRNPNPARHHEWHAPDGKVYKLIDLPYAYQTIIIPEWVDIAGAVPTDPNNCALARCASRKAGGLPAQVGVSKAYIPIASKGIEVMYRCKVPKDTLNAINHFDATGIFPKEGFVFTGIPPSETLESQRSQEKRRRERWGTLRGGTGQQRQQLYLRNAARRAQIFVVEE